MNPVKFVRSCLKGLFFSTIFMVFALPAMAQTANDLCSNPELLTSGTTCSSVSGTFRPTTGTYTATAGIAAFCGNAGSPDIWYSFVAQSTSPVIRLSGLGNHLKTDGRLQIFSAASCTPATLNANSYGCASGTG